MPIFRQTVETLDLKKSKSIGSTKTWWVWMAAFGLLVFVFIRNYGFYKAGLLDPNFGVIHQAFEFNFGQLPFLLILGAFIFLLIKVVFGTRSGGAAFWFLFLAIDLLGLRVYMTNIEPVRLEVREVQVYTPKLSQPVRIIHLSDIQAGAITQHEQDLFDLIRELKPDMIINTGDYLQVVPPATFESEFPKLISLFRSVKPRLGSYGVFGDTDLNFYRIPLDALKPLEILSSRSRKIETGGGIISLHGLSLYESKKSKWALRSINDWLTQTNPGAFKILFGHSPNFALAVQDHPIDLCLAGHTHGGQVRLPFFGALVTDSDVPKSWSRGMTRIGVPLLNVSAGAGSNRFGGLPHLRFNCPTEVTLIELLPPVLIR
jgi:predicted MPP superfamily phosphohydrolase